MNQRFWLASAAAALMLAGCGGGADDAARGDAAGGGAAGDSGGAAASGEAAKRQPGSWSQKAELLELTGPQVKPGEMEQMKQVMNMVGAVSICVTPEMAAAESITDNLKDMGGDGADCTFDKQNISGGRMDFAATCKAGDGTVKMAGTGTHSATAQDFTLTTSTLGPGGEAQGTMKMRIVGKRTGECTNRDMQVPANAR